MRFALLFLTLGFAALLAAPKHTSLLREAADATKAGDHAGALVKLEEAAVLRPDYPRLQLMLARIYAALERPADALAALQRLGTMGLRLKVANDPELAALYDSAEFKILADRLIKGPAPVAAGETTLTIPDMDGIIESCLIDPATQIWYFGDVRNRCIWQRDPGTGRLRKFTSDKDALDGVFKLALSPDRKTLWAATATVSAMTGDDAEDGKRSALVAHDFATGRVLARYPVPADGRKHLLGDFILTPDGSIVATDSLAPVIWQLPSGGDHLVPFLENDDFINLQGLAFGEHGISLFVADYTNGIWRIHMGTKKALLLTAPANATFFGIDGIYPVPGGLLAVQNGVNPQRVLHIEPAESGISGARVVASGGGGMTDLSLGTVSKDLFHFVGNSGWALFDPAPETPPAARNVTILSVPLE